MTDWNPNYAEEFQRRLNFLNSLRANPDQLAGVRGHYINNPVDWINDWCVTSDPRNVGTDKPIQMPFLLFPSQIKFINWLHDLVFNKKNNGLVDKARDMGATWLCAAFSVWLITYHDNIAVGWGSRKSELVDKAGDPKCIFAKIREIINNLPEEFAPNVRDVQMLIENLDNGSTIAGEGGDGIGRGGRTTVYFKDEAAFLERPELIEASLGNNTEVQIDISTHNGTNTIFYNKSKSYPDDRVFIFNWYDNPVHDEEWLKKKLEYYNDELGLPHLFEQEIMRNPGGSVPNVIIPQKYVRAAIDAHLKLGYEPSGEKRLALDVADEGGDKNALADRYGILIKQVEVWGEGTTTETANRAITSCDVRQVYKLVYDSIGVGAGVKGESKRQNEERERHGREPIDAIGWNAGGAVVFPYQEFVKGKTNKDMFKNANAQAWWELRERFRKTWECIERDELHDPDDLISLSSNITNLQQLVDELSQPKRKDTTDGKIQIDKKPDGAKSPNMADAVKIAFAPLNAHKVQTTKVSGLF